MNSLFGDEFIINIEKPKAEDVIKKAKTSDASEMDVDKALKSKKLTVEERLDIIKLNVLRVLKKQKDNVRVIKSSEELNEYVDKAIKFGKIAIDTETDNSLLTCKFKLMGLCLYFPEDKQVYIPVNHVDWRTNERLPWQCTEEDCGRALTKIVDSNTYTIFHNASFDYQVLKCNCGVTVIPSYDTITAARLIDENEEASLKSQYVSKIDKRQEKYSIEKLFEDIPYAYCDPEIFALYAATDSLMTYKLHDCQMEFFSRPENNHLYNFLFKQIEMEIVVITAEMEMTGVAVDKEFGNRLKQKYELMLSEVDEKINVIMDEIKDIIAEWRLSKEANQITRQYAPAKSKLTRAKLEQQYNKVDEKGKRYRDGKTKTQKLPEKINLASPEQLAILLFDILNAPTTKTKDGQQNRATGETELKELSDDLKERILNNENLENIVMPEQIMNLCKLILERRGIVKLISTYIDTIPSLANLWDDGRIRFHFNALGTDTGRYSSGGKIKFLDKDGKKVCISGINAQNIPSHGDAAETRLLFVAPTVERTVEATDDYYEVPEYEEVFTERGWVYAGEIVAGDVLLNDDVRDVVKSIIKINKSYRIYC